MHTKSHAPCHGAASFARSVFSRFADHSNTVAHAVAREQVYRHCAETYFLITTHDLRPSSSIPKGPAHCATPRSRGHHRPPLREQPDFSGNTPGEYAERYRVGERGGVSATEPAVKPSSSACPAARSNVLIYRSASNRTSTTRNVSERCLEHRGHRGWSRHRSPTGNPKLTPTPKWPQRSSH